jgi:ABC-type transport system involved in multi-copper enzyme maturation permease subunit
MLLLRAEFTKLRRPLTFCVALVAVAASLLLAWQGVMNAAKNDPPSATSSSKPTCRDFALPPGPLCDQAVAVQEQINAYQQQRLESLPSTRHNRRQTDASPVEHPLGAGKVALGFMASLPGALLILVLAAGHVGSEWNDRTIKVLLCQEGRRWRVLGAKLVSLWVVAIAILILDWAALAAVSPILRAAYPLAAPGLSWSSAWTSVAADAARAPLVIAVFALLGLTASVIVRNALGAFALASSVLIASLAAAGNFAALAPWTLAYWVSGWMRFRSHGYVIYHFWVDGFPASVHPPGALSGFIGLLGVVAAAALTAFAVFQHTDVTT